ncbi:MAG: sodium:alanine symporter family protein [Gammaproteobacteria bacterium]|nr:sodium:alanine symporter family protein [Gammaproteobacteria bacterium]PCH64471.1 MAG: sodium:alanine symporter family protein [Gammaproteobacteria bacterium]
MDSLKTLADSLENYLGTLSGYIWAGIPWGDSGAVIPVLITLLLGVGVYLMLGLSFIPWRKFTYGVGLLIHGAKTTAPGDVTPFQALMTTLSATVGTGNIVGVATAIALGGPGAIFWMWITALFGMATKYAEVLLAVRFREMGADNKHVGGPMYYIKNGLNKRWHWLAIAYAIFGAIAGLGIGNMVQANSVADAMESSFSIPAWISGLTLAALVGFVIIGGIKRIAAVAAKLVPFMAIAYVVCCLIVIGSHWQAIPHVFVLIIDSAFNGAAATGGFAGAAVWAAIRFGVARGIFSNEAGLGSGSIAHAAAKTNSPVKQGFIGVLGTVIDTLIICSMTAFVILLTGAWTSGENGHALSNLAFNSVLGDIGSDIITIGLVVFAFTTLLGWSYYGERCAEYLFGKKIILFYRLLWIIMIPLGAIGSLKIVWVFSDVMNGLMALPNLIALIMLSPIVFKITRDYFSKKEETA